MKDDIDRRPSTSRLVRAYRNNEDLTLMEVRKDYYGLVSSRLGVLAISEGKDGIITARLDSVEITGLEHA